MDSIVTNAASHYLHNLFFLRGDDLGKAQESETVEAELYRAKAIETFDTCFFKRAFFRWQRIFVYGVPRHHNGGQSQAYAGI